LATILRQSIRKNHLQLDSASVLNVAVKMLEKQRMRPNFGNAGAANTLVSEAIKLRLVRLGKIENPAERKEEEDEETLKAEDFKVRQHTGSPPEARVCFGSV
jgi:hypothetical protein